jgi:hypothetical protein
MANNLNTTIQFHSLHLYRFWFFSMYISPWNTVKSIAVFFICCGGGICRRRLEEYMITGEVRFRYFLRWLKRRGVRLGIRVGEIDLE